MIPCVLFGSCTSKNPNEIIKLLLGELPQKSEIEPNVTGYPWHINTKYYEVDVKLCTLERKLLVSSKNAQLVQAVVLYFNSDDVNGLCEANKWLPYLKEYGVDIQILLCDQCKENSKSGVTKLSAQEWCIKEGFELVELNPLLDEDWETEQDFIETTGIKRVKQALEAHIWPNLTLKELQEPTSMSALLHGGICKSTFSDNENDSGPSCSENFSNNSVLELLENDIEGPIEFNELFGQIVSLKEKAAMLPDDKRKEFAERVVLTYWKAIGGDEEEIFDT